MQQFRQDFFEQQKGNRTNQRAGQRAKAAKDDDDHQLSRPRPVHDVGRDIFLPAGKKRPRQTADHRRNQIAGDLEVQRHETHRLDPRFIILDGFKHNPETRAYNEHQHDADKHQRHPDKVIEAQRLPQIDWHKFGTINAHPVIATKLFKADEQKEQHLRKGKGDHNKIDAACAQRQEPDNQPQHAADTKRHQHVDPAIEQPVILADTHTVGADTHKGGMAKGHHSAIAKHKIEPHGGHAKQHDPHRNIIPEGQVSHAGIDREQPETKQQHKQRAVAQHAINQDFQCVHHVTPLAGTGRSAEPQAQVTSGYRPSSRPAPGQHRQPPPAP